MREPPPPREIPTARPFRDRTAPTRAIPVNGRNTSCANSPCPHLTALRRYLGRLVLPVYALCERYRERWHVEDDADAGDRGVHLRLPFASRNVTRSHTPV